MSTLDLDELLGALDVTRAPVGALLQRGDRVQKIRTTPGDAHMNGAQGTIVETAGAVIPELRCYLVAWDDCPEVPLFVAADRVALLTDAS